MWSGLLRAARTVPLSCLLLWQATSTTLAGMRNQARPVDVSPEGLSAGGCHEHLSCVGA